MMNETTEDGLLDCGLPLGQCDDVRLIQKILLSVSIIAVLASLVCIVLLKKYSFFHERIICHILVADLLTNIAYLSGDGSEQFSKTPGCVAQGFFLQLFPFAELVWISILTVYVYIKMVKSKETEQKEWLYTLIGWLLPTVIACIPFIKNSYGTAEAPFCWIKGTSVGHFYRIFFYWVPAVIAWVGMVITCSYIAAVSKRAMRNYVTPEDTFTTIHRKQVGELLIPLAGYSGCFLLLNTALFTNRITQIWVDATQGTMIFHITALSLWGVILSTLFLLTNRQNLFTRSNLMAGTGSLVRLFLCSFSEVKPAHHYTPESTPSTTLERQHNN